jgi:hypothetical protein
MLRSDVCNAAASRVMLMYFVAAVMLLMLLLAFNSAYGCMIPKLVAVLFPICVLVCVNEYVAPSLHCW